ncbi:MAG: hypothetical protein M1828_007068 [Chrysothrix sp. TS-e1954]|nr:MAG: hypothetical protein M1828_007068 [Chrysothrix sp. TS-e1954]
MKKRLSLVAAFVSFAVPSTAYWQPNAGASWQITLAEPPSLSIPRNLSALDFDLFDTPATTVSTLHSQSHYTICYFSAGSYEQWRSDASQFDPSDLGNPLDGWPGERWLNVNSKNVRQIMRQRMNIAKTKGCDAIDPDNVDGYDNDNGHDLTEDDAVDYVQFLAAEGHQRGMAVGLKNAGSMVPRVLKVVQFQVNEQCVQYDDCDQARPFIAANKPVFHIEYQDGVPSIATFNKICNNPTRTGFSTLMKHISLDEFFEACPGQKASEGISNGESSNTTATTPNPLSVTSDTTSSATHNLELWLESPARLLLAAFALWHIL